MRVKFLVSGESPEIGTYQAGEERVIAETIARVYIARNMAVQLDASMRGKKEVNNGDK